MKAKRFNWILYLISATILVTIVVQLYWNYRNYQQNKQHIINEIQLSLDNAVETYFANLSKQNFLTIANLENPTEAVEKEQKNIFKRIFNNSSETKDTSKSYIQSIDIKTDDETEFQQMKSKFADSAIAQVEHELVEKLKAANKQAPKKIIGFTQLSSDEKTGVTIMKDSPKIKNVQIFTGKKAADSIKLIKGLQTIFISVMNDSIKYKELDSLLHNELSKKKINITYGFVHYKNDTIFNEHNIVNHSALTNKSTSKSTFFTDGQRMELFYSNPIAETLRRSYTGILLSLILSLGVIASLFYLLKIINQQKQLAEIKNDLISNITHEFKTPIATLSAAIEAMTNFNTANDRQKTRTYLDISSLQLKNLNAMVEKLLETATLDSEKLLLHKEETDIVCLVEKLVDKYKLIAQKKNLQFSSNSKNLNLKIDTFHLENAISNLIDNAIKYGGNNIDIILRNGLTTVEITMKDNGNGIDKSQHDKIFDKFYRIPKGNVHDIKGFGIGLYYTRKIIEKHGGTIRLQSNPGNTIFEIRLPNE